jgi:hypothetical protein
LQKDTVAKGYGKLQKGTEVAKGYWDYYNSKFARKKDDKFNIRTAHRRHYGTVSCRL